MSAKQMSVTKRAVMAAGGTGKVAKELDCSLQSVRRWTKNGDFGGQDASKVIKLCDMGRGFFRPEQIRPDVFGGV
jgi:hypothetical protein